MREAFTQLQISVEEALVQPQIHLQIGLRIVVHLQLGLARV